MTEVAIVTYIPSPYQVELFDRVAADGAVRPWVVYLRPAAPDRRWARPVPRHTHTILSGDDPAAVRDRLHAADLVVFGYYADPRARTWMAARAASGRPWVYWGERPGFGRWGVLGRLRRRVRLASLRRSCSPIWGIGEWAVDGWRAEFGTARPYLNLPYSSDLARFAPPAAPPAAAPGERRLLYSGSLIARKGVDLLAAAFTAVAATRPGLRLELVGEGVLEPRLRAALAAVGDRVRFTGFIDWAGLPAAYHWADVLVAPSRHDGWGLIVPEGLAAGLPVIGTDRTGAARELIRPGENGWVCRAGDLASLTAALAEAADLPDDRLAAMRRAALASVAGHQLGDGAARFAAAAREALAGGGG